MSELLRLLEENARHTDEELAAMLGIPERDVREKIEECERAGIICGYKTIVDWEKTE